MLTGVRMEIASDKLTLVATDRFRLAMREFDWQPTGDVEDVAVLVPARTLAEAAKTLGSAGSSVEVSLASGDGLLGLAGNGRRATSRLLDAEFPKYRQLLPSEHTSAAILEVSPLVEAIKRVSLVAERGTQVRLEFADGIAAAVRRWRRRGQRRGRTRRRLHGRAGHDRVQPGVPARRPRRVAHGPRALVLHHTQPARAGQAGGGGWGGARRVPVPADAGAAARLIGVSHETRLISGCPATNRSGPRRSRL